jgi:hypothetical protein
MDGTDFFETYRSMLGDIARHCRVRVVTKAYRGEAVLVGFPEDVEYVQMLWTSAHLTFVSKIDPSWDSSRTVDENVKILKEAGRKWGYIAEQANTNGFECTANDGRLKAAYRRQCKAEGVPATAHTQRHAAYRAAFAQSFSYTIYSRLQRMRAANAETVASTPGSALALRDRMSDVNEMLYQLFPHLRPMSEEDREKAMAELLRQEAERLASMTPAQRAAHERAKARQDARYRAQWEREQAKVQDRAGSAAGSAAAATVDLGAGKLRTESRREVES